MKLLIFPLYYLVLSNAPPAGAVQKKCCEGENAVVGKHCINGKNISLECESRFIMSASEALEIFKLKEDGTLANEHESVDVNEYCVTHRLEEVFIMCYYETTEVVYKNMKSKVGAILGYVSVFFIVLTIAVYFMVPRLLDAQGICIVHSLLGLGNGYFFLGVLQLNYLKPFFCAFFAFLTYTLFMYAFFWLNILAFNIWRTTVKPNILKFTKNWLKIYHIFGIGGTSLCLMILLIAQYSDAATFQNIRPGIAEGSCWFKSSSETFVYFYGPISVLLCLNVVYYIWTVIAVWILLNYSDEKKATVLKYRLTLCIKLFFIMGITWIFEVLSAVFNKDDRYVILWVIVDILNALQGVLIFLILVVFRSRARKGLANRKVFLTRFPASWKNAHDVELYEIEEEEVSLSTMPKV